MTSRTDATPPDAVAPPPGHPRFPLVDALRAIAAVFVLVTHSSGLTGFNSANRLGAVTARLDVGVTIFFVVSGFLLYRPFVAARLNGLPRPSPLTYARRRLLRIVPAYWVALTVTGLALPRYVVGPQGADWWAYYGFLSNWRGGWIVTGISPAWSLCVEVAFYVALPLIALAAARGFAGRARERQVRLELVALAVSSAVALAGRAVVYDQHPRSIFPNSLPGCWAWFAGGMTLAVLSAAYHGRSADELPRPLRLVTAHPGWCWGAAGALLLVTASPIVGLPRTFFYAPLSTVAFAGEHALYLVVALLLVAPAIFTADTGWPRRVLGRPELARLGLVSYGVFLYHMPLLLTLRPLADHPFGFVLLTAATLAAATLAATVSYVLVERPTLRFKNGRGDGGQRRRVRAGAGAVADPAG